MPTLTADHLTEQLLWRVPKEGGAAHQELVQDDAHRPPVHRLPVALAQDHLWGDVFRGAAHLERRQHSKEMNPELFKSGRVEPRKENRRRTCLSRNSLVSFSMCPSYRFVVKLIKPILERPKSVSLMCPKEVMRRLRRESDHFSTKHKQSGSEKKRRRPGASLVRFEVSVDDAVVVEILQSEDGLGEVHASHIHRQRADVLQQRGAVSTCRGQ